MQSLDLGITAHVRLQCLRDLNAVILAVKAKIVFKQSYEHTRRSNNGIIKGMSKILLAVLSLDLDSESASLRISEIGAGAYLKILLLLGAPCLNIIGLYLKIGKVACATLKRSDGNV